MKIAITGISGPIGRMVARMLVGEGHAVLGIDRRPWPDAPVGVRMHEADIRKRPAEDVFRSERPDAAIHMATVSHFRAESEERYRINLHGTRVVFDHCHRYGVKRAIFVGRHTVYGATSDSPLKHTEEDPPLAGSTFPELADLVAADLFAGSAIWRWPDITTTVLRIVYTLGPSRYGTLANYVKGPFVPTILGFDPLFQFVHEEDAARAISLAVLFPIRGVYNVAGPQPVPLSELCRRTGRIALPVPQFVFGRTLGRLGLPRLPQGSINHVKFPVVVDDAVFRRATGFAHQFDEVQTMESFRWA